jgi:hypothetical protein
MNWIERLPEIKGKDLYSQSGEGLILEYIWNSLLINGHSLCGKCMFDIGSGDGFVLSNSRHLRVMFRSLEVILFEKERGLEVTLENCTNPSASYPNIISIDIDGNDYWILDKMLPHYKPEIVVAEFNAMYTDSRTIAYNPDHVWAGDSYYGFTFEAGKKLAEKHGYKVIFQLADMNMFMVRADLIEGLTIPEVTYKQNDFFKRSNREDWVYIS